MTLTTTDLMRLPGRLAHRLSAERAQRRLVRDFEALTAACPPATPAMGPRIGFATFGSGCWHLALEALLAHALAVRGARPELLVCDLPDLPICDERTIYSREADRCAGCIDDKRALLDICGVRWRGVSSLVSPDTPGRARLTVAALDDDELEAHEERGWPIGKWLHVSASHFLRCDARGDGPEKIETRRRLLATAIVIVEAVERWLDEVRPEVVVAESGAHFMWRIAMELARAREIPVVCREMGKGGWDSHIYALNADSMAPDLDRTWSEVRDQLLSVAEQSDVATLLENLPAKTYVQRTTVKAGMETNLRTRLGVPPGRAVAVAFTNVTWDLATAGRDVAYAGVFDWVCETIRSFAAIPDTHLIVRAHPAEASVQTRERITDQIEQAWPSGLPGVTVVPPEQPVAARDLCELADLVLAYNSTTGIEAAAYGNTVVVCGAPHYRGKGFTHDVSSKTEYLALLERWAAGDLVAPDGAAQLARRYAHLFFLRYHVPMRWTTSPLEPPYQLTIRSLRELQPGQNPALDVVCRGILEGRQILLPRPQTD